MVSNEDVIAWYNSRFNKKGKRVVTVDTSLSTGRYPWATETAEIIMKEYFEMFSVDPANFDYFKYWPVESGLFIFGLCSCGKDEDEPKPLTILMLAESARAGKWLYE
ncbi:DUF1493 family protein [Buttiauxella brennerae]|uniref:DUF1493 family protein n=1 Tax=Buttiauxella brennerae TaxID=82988 RepID=UPI00286F7EE1|nr:DUF1493 family protein [Buttiauxella brennerae]